MRVMATYYTGDEYKIVDVHLDSLVNVSRDQIAMDCLDLISVVEVLGGVDYDKAGLGATTATDTGAEFVAIVMK